MVTFTYLATVLVLPSPDLKDREILELRTLIDRAKDGSIYAFSNKPISTKFDLMFSKVNRPKVLETIDFLKLVADKPVEYLDYNGAAFRVAILNEPFDSIHVGIRNNTFNLNLEVI